MTELDTTELRALAERVEAIYPPPIGTMLRDVADTVDALRADVESLNAEVAARRRLMMYDGNARKRAEAERDALRAEVKAAATMHEQARALAQSALAERGALRNVYDPLWDRTVSAEAERDALRRIIADAPHDFHDCMKMAVSPERRDMMRCTCWKSRIEDTR